MNLKPELVKLEGGKVGMRLTLGRYVATGPALPEGMETWPEERRDAFLKGVTEQMTEHLVRMKREDERKLNKKAARNA